MAKRSTTRTSRKKSRSTASAPRRAGRTAAAHLVFGRKNYLLLLGSIGLVVLGYALMAFDNARGVDARGVYLSLESTLSLTVAPLLLLAGYLGVVGAILWRPKSEADEPDAEDPEAVAE